MKDRVMEEVKRLFRPEFLNRIDDIIVFHPLNMENIREIAGIMTASIAGNEGADEHCPYCGQQCQRLSG